MSLHNGLDTVAIISLGVHTKTYSSALNGGKMANLFASLGLFEDAPTYSPVDTSWISVWWHRLSPQLLINKIFPIRKFRLRKRRS